jgi:drug/metabolite transporter (DMT)-like permease
MADRASARRIVADVVLFAVACSWGATFPLAKRLLVELPPFCYLTLRFALAAALLFVIARRSLRGLSRRSIADGLLLGFFLAGGYGLQTLGLKTASATVAAFLTGLSVVIVPLLGAARGRRPGAHEWIGALLALAGLALLTLQPGAGFRPGVGEILLVGCAVFFALHIAYMDRAAAHARALPLGLLQLSGVTAITFLFSTGEKWPADLSGQATWAIIAMAVVCSAAAFTLQAWAQRFTSPTHVGLLFAFEPVAAALFAWWWLGEKLTGGQWIGAALILTGIVVTEARGSATTAPAP